MPNGSRRSAASTWFTHGASCITPATWRGRWKTPPPRSPGAGACSSPSTTTRAWISRYWTLVKRLYNASAVARPLLVLVHCPYLFGARFAVRALSGRLMLERGMSLWHDMIDWLGGYPFEVAKPDAIVAFHRERGFAALRVKTCGRRHGCNEFVFERTRR